MKLTYEAHGLRHSVEIDGDDVNSYEVVTMFWHLMSSVGFSEQSIAAALVADRDELGDRFDKAQQERAKLKSRREQSA